MTTHHEEVAKRLIEMIKAGTAPWQKPWSAGQNALPHNLNSGHVYSGGNAVWLMAQERPDPRWGTFKQIVEAGGMVRKGSRGTRCLLYQTTSRSLVRDSSGKPKRDSNGRKRYMYKRLKRPFTKHFYVFNAEQAEGLPALPETTEEPAWKRHQAAERILESHGVPLRNVAGDRAYYHLKRDEIVLPLREQFPDADAYYQTALHELSHSTGHESRLNRETLIEGVRKGFGSVTYAREELRAEISALMIGSHIGVGHNPERGAAYVEGWLVTLEEDPKEVYRAAADAQRIARHVLEIEDTQRRAA